MGLLTLFLAKCFSYNISMKIWVCRSVVGFLSALAIVTSADFVFAQKQLKYVPQAIKGTKTIPYVVNPKLSPAVRANFAVPVVRPAVPQASPTVAPAVERAVTAQVAAQTAPRVPVALPSNLQKDILTGVQALQKFRPGWKSELMLSGFTRQQLDLVEQAFKETDQFLFELDAQGNWLKPRFAEWNYLARYTKILTDNAYGELALNDGQIKTLFGKFSRLDDVFTRLNLQSFLLTHEGRAPNTNAPGEEGKLARHAKYNLDKRDGRKMNPEVEEYVYDKMPAKLKTPKPSYGPTGRTPNRTPEEILGQVEQFIKENQRFPTISLENSVERSLRRAFDGACSKAENRLLNDDTSRKLLALKEQWVAKYAKDKSPQEILDYMMQYMREHNGKLPSSKSENSVEKSYAVALKTFHKKYRKLSETELEELTESVRMLERLCRQNIKQIADDKTSQEILDYMTQYMEMHDGKLPSGTSTNPVERSYRDALYTFHKKYKNMNDEELEELDEVVRDLEKLCRAIIGSRVIGVMTKAPQHWLELIELWVSEHKRWPSAAIEEEEALYKGAQNAIYYHPNDPASIRIKELKEKYGKHLEARRTPQKWLEIIEPWVIEHKRWPSVYADEEKQMYRGARKAIENHPNDPASVRMRELKEKYQ